MTEPLKKGFYTVAFTANISTLLTVFSSYQALNLYVIVMWMRKHPEIKFYMRLSYPEFGNFS